MNTLGNILWFILIGLWSAIALFLTGLVWCITIVGIPVGVQCFKIASFAALPFGRDVVVTGSTGKMLLNVIWLIFGGLENALGLLVIGAVFCVTIIGIPFGLQCFKIAKIVLMPFGAEIVPKGGSGDVIVTK